MLLLVPAIISCVTSQEVDLSSITQSCPVLAEQPRPAFWLCSIGSRDAMLNDGDLTARLSLADLPSFEELIAVGPVVGLRAEITVYRGARYVSTVRGGKDLTRPVNIECLSVSNRRHR